MTAAQTARLLAVLTAAYPASKIRADQHTVALWQEMLGDLPEALVLAAAKRLIAISPYPPAIADVRRSAAEGLQEASGQPEADQAWTMLARAISRYGFYEGEAALRSLPEQVRRAAQRFGWRELCLSELDHQAVLRAQFIKTYEAERERERNEVRLPAGIKKRLRALAGQAGGLYLEGGEADAGADAGSR